MKAINHSHSKFANDDWFAIVQSNGLYKNVLSRINFIEMFVPLETTWNSTKLRQAMLVVTIVQHPIQTEMLPKQLK